MIAFLTAKQIKPKVLILCSLSPYFKDDLKDLKPAWVKWWRNNFIDSDYSFTKIAPEINSKTYIVVWDKESKNCLNRARDAKKKLKNAKLIIIKGAEHNITQKKYLVVVKKLISNL